MPLYEFECAQCGKVFEELVRMGSTGEGLVCPGCNGGQVRKLMSTCFGRTSDGGATRSVGGQGCACGGDCGSCGGNCSCHH